MSSLRKYTFNIGAAGGGDDIRRLDVSGPLLYVLDASAGFQVSCDSEAPIPCERGMKFRRPFDQIALQNLSTAANVVVLLIGDGDVEDYRPISRPTGPTRSKTLWNSPIGAAALVPGTLPVLEVADTTRATVFVRGQAANAGLIMMSADINGTQLITAVSAGQSERLAYTGPLFLFGQVAGDNAAIYGSYY